MASMPVVPPSTMSPITYCVIDDYGIYLYNSELSVLDSEITSSSPGSGIYCVASTLRYTLRKAGNVSVRIFNMRGQQIRLLQQSWQSAGEYRIEWDGKNDKGIGVVSGVYLYRIVLTKEPRRGSAPYPKW